MYIRCNKCGWSQDDFWHEGYNPFKFLKENYEKDLLTKKLDTPLEKMKQFTNRDKYVSALKSTIDNIKNMHWSILAQYESSDKLCPKCKSKYLVMD